MRLHGVGDVLDASFSKGRIIEQVQRRNARAPRCLGKWALMCRLGGLLTLPYTRLLTDFVR